MTSTDDERLLLGELRRAMMRLRAIRDLVDRIGAEPHMTEEHLAAIYTLTREEQG